MLFIAMTLDASGSKLIQYSVRRRFLSVALLLPEPVCTIYQRNPETDRVCKQSSHPLLWFHLTLDPAGSTCHNRFPIFSVWTSWGTHVYWTPFLILFFSSYFPLLNQCSNFKLVQCCRENKSTHNFNHLLRRAVWLCPRRPSFRPNVGGFTGSPPAQQSGMTFHTLKYDEPARFRLALPLIGQQLLSFHNVTRISNSFLFIYFFFLIGFSK